MANVSKERHDELLKMLVAFKEVCEKNDIWYSLAYGTALGAYREGGFIPWDGDADVYLMLKDVEVFRTAFAAEKREDVFLHNFEADPKCLQSHDCLFIHDENVSLDIYPLVGAPSTRKEQERFTRLSGYLDRIIRSKYVDIRLCKKRNRLLVAGAKVIDHCIPDRLLKKNIYKRAHKYDFDTAEFLVELGNESGSDGCIPKSVFLQRRDISFEGITFKVPEKIEEYLCRVYGTDYMTPKQY